MVIDEIVVLRYMKCWRCRTWCGVRVIDPPNFWSEMSIFVWSVLSSAVELLSEIVSLYYKWISDRQNTPNSFLRELRSDSSIVACDAPQTVTAAWPTSDPPSVLWHCWLGHQICKIIIPKWPVMCPVGGPCSTNRRIC